VQVGGGGFLRAGLALQLTLLVLVGAQPAALTLVVFQREVCAHRTLDCNGTISDSLMNIALLTQYESFL